MITKCFSFHHLNLVVDPFQPTSMEQMVTMIVNAMGIILSILAMAFTGFRKLSKGSLHYASKNFLAHVGFTSS
jgi:hypothetical protein